jgi:acetyltransferase-like isoleucine patch superfamily enzyme
MRLTIDERALERLHAARIHLRYNQGPPRSGRYGWLRAGEEMVVRDRRLWTESNAGFLGGPYTGIKGSRPASGFCQLGAFSYSYSALPEGLVAGRYCSISTGLAFLDAQHPVDALTTSGLLVSRNSLFDPCRTEAVERFQSGFKVSGGHYPRIGNDVWIGCDVTLAMNIEIGTGAIIASGSIVTRDVAPYAIVAGVPAREKKLRFPVEVVQRLLASRWWDLDPAAVFESDLHDPVAWLDRYERDPRALPPWAPPVFRFRDLVGED